MSVFALSLLTVLLFDSMKAKDHIFYVKQAFSRLPLTSCQRDYNLAPTQNKETTKDHCTRNLLQHKETKRFPTI